MTAPWEMVPPPTVAGGTGGSGTRVVTEILSSAGVFMGSRLNRSGDALDLAKFDLRWGKPYLAAEQAGEIPPFEQMEADLQSSVRDHLRGYDPAAGPWGWKHPHAYLLLPWLDTVIPDLRFVHVIRDGRRMVRSHNQNQPQRYGEVTLDPDSMASSSKVRAVEFWSWANERAADYGEQRMDERYMRMRFEDICADPQTECARLIAFAYDGAQAPEADVAQAAQLVSDPTERSSPLSMRRLKRFARQLDYQRRGRKIERAAQHSLKRFGYI
jgi:Sulfotransferase family